MYDFGLRLKEIRESKHLTQRQVAERIALDASTISGYENNTKTPSVEVLTKLIALYHVSADYILGIDNRRMIYLDGLTEQEINLISLLIEDLKSKNKNVSK